MYQRNYSRPHENNDPLKGQLYWDGYQWILRAHSREEIIKLNEKKVQLVNVPLDYNIKKNQLKKFLLEKMVEKDVVSSKLTKEQLDKKIIDIELSKDTNVVLLTMESLELARMMTLLDGIILLGHTIRLSMYKDINDLSLTNIQKANALANSANVAAKSAAISLAAYQSILYNKGNNANIGGVNGNKNDGKGGITLNIFNSGNEITRNKDTSNVIKIMGVIGNDEENQENFGKDIDWKELEEDMNDAFEQFGNIEELLVIDFAKEKLGAELGSVFVRYSNQQEAENAYKNMCNKKYSGNDIRIVFFPEYVFINEISNKKEEKQETEEIGEKIKNGK